MSLPGKPLFVDLGIFFTASTDIKILGNVIIPHLTMETIPLKVGAV